MSWIDAARERLANLFLRRDRDLDDEIAYHLELETARQISLGADPRTARARALARFGNPGRIGEATRDARGGDALTGGLQDLRWAGRSLRKSPGFTALALVTLALGIGATTAAFTVLDAVLLRPLPFPRSDRLVVLNEVASDHSRLAPSYPNFDDWRSQASSFESVVSTSGGRMRVTGSSGETIRTRALGVSRGFFAAFRVRPIAGREFTADENTNGAAPTLMVSEEFWRTQMNADPRLGVVHLGKDAATVVGVVPAGFELDGRKFDVFFPHERGPGTVRNAHYLTVYARLETGATLASARTEMTAIARRLARAFGNDEQAQDVAVTPLREHIVGGQRGVLVAVFVGATLVLLVACINLISAQLARGVARGREIAVRAALGASRGRLLRQLCSESALLALIGSVLGSLLAFGLVVMVRTMGAGLLPRLSEIAIDWRLLAFVVATTAAVAVAIGVYPAVRTARRDPVDALRGGRGETAGVRAGVWRLLVGGQVAMAVMLVAASSLLVRTLHNILNDDVGFAVHGLVTASLSSGDSPGSRLAAIRQDLAALPGAKGVAYSTYYPMDYGNWSAPLLRPTDPEDHDWPVIAGFRVVTANFFDVLQMRVVSGRDFSDQDREGAPYVAIVSTSVATKLWPGENPIGRLVRSNQDVKHQLTVVGVVPEAVNWRLPRGSQYEIYVPFAQHPDWQHDPIAFVRTDNPTAMIAAVRATLRATARDIPASVALLDDRIAATAASRRFAMMAIVAFGTIALLLAAIGIYGVLAYSVTTRRFEIGVRMALGATSTSILRRTLTGAAALAFSGIAVGSLAALLAMRYIATLLYGVTTSDPRAYLAGAALLLIAALLGAYAPARRASRVDPLSAIRGET